ncbi:ATP-dependent nuclease [Tessaracoccus sp. Y36]
MSSDWRERFESAHPEAIDLKEADATGFDFFLESIELITGATIPIQRVGVTALVGANNAGKSTILRETVEFLRQNRHLGHSERISVATVRTGVRGDLAQVIGWLGDNSHFIPPSQGSAGGFQRPTSGIIPLVALRSLWASPHETFGDLANAFVFYGNAQGRFAFGGSVEMRENVDDPAQHPVHHLQDSKALLDELSEITKKVFGVPLTLDSLARTLRLRVGEIDEEVPPVNNISQEYREKMAALRPLDEQGDGMRSYLGQLLPTLTAAFKVLLLDEPEAFLHPPQAHALGLQLGQLAMKQGIQIVLATHDKNLLTGLLESGVDVSVVRLDRGSGSTAVHDLDAAQLRALWSDPVLRYTNILDGLFHRLVVVAEAEGDCAFLNAALDCPARSHETLPRHEILFVPTGGKDGMAKACAALSKIGVPTVAAPDLDMLADQSALRTLLESLGEDWTDDLSKLWERATASIRVPREQVRVGRVLDAISAILTPERDANFSTDHRDAVQAQLRARPPWRDVKDHGLSAFKGEARAHLMELLAELHKRGVVLVEVGELENLAPEVTVRKGPGWIHAALRQGAQCNDITQRHVDRILAVGVTRGMQPSATNDTSRR